jgi:hypothetical protein
MPRDDDITDPATRGSLGGQMVDQLERRARPAPPEGIASEGGHARGVSTVRTREIAGAGQRLAPRSSARVCGRRSPKTLARRGPRR